MVPLLLLSMLLLLLPCFLGLRPTPSQRERPSTQPDSRHCWLLLQLKRPQLQHRLARAAS
jgi:hypothetical protein